MAKQNKINPRKQEQRKPTPGYIDVMMTIALLIVVTIPLIFAPKYLYDMYDLTKATALRFSFILILLAWTLKIMVTGRMDWRRTPLDLPILAFLSVLIISTFTSQNLIISIVGGYKRHEGLMTWLMYMAVFFTATNWVKSRWQVVTLMIPLFAVTTIMSFYGILQHYGIDFLQFGSQYDVWRSFATSGNPVFLGGYLAFALPLMVAVFIEAKDYILKGIVLIIVAMAAVCLAFTLTRGGWIGFAVALLVMTPFIPKKVFKRNAIWLVTMAVIAAIAVFVMFVMVDTTSSGHKSGEIIPRLMQMFQLGGSAGTRTEMWKTSAHMIVKRPLHGIGLETYKDFFPQNRTLALIQMEGEMAMPDRPHNEFFYLPSSMGLPGYAMYLWIIAAFFFLMFRFVRKIEDETTKMMVIGTAGSAVAYWIQSFFAFSMVVISPVFWLVAGCAVSLGLAKMREEKRLIPYTATSFKVPPGLASSFVAIAVIVSVLLGTFAINAVRADAYYFQGIAAQNFNLQFATMSWENAVSLNPTLNLYRLMLASGYQRLATTTDRTMADKALQVYQEGLAFNRNDEDMLVGEGDLYQFIAYQYKDQTATSAAEAAYKRAIEIDPNFTHALVALGRIYLAEGRGGEAGPLLEKALTIATPERNLGTWKEAMNDLSVLYAQRGDYQQSLQITEQVLKADAADASAKEQKAKLLKAMRAPTVAPTKKGN